MAGEHGHGLAVAVAEGRANRHRRLPPRQVIIDVLHRRPSLPLNEVTFTFSEFTPLLFVGRGEDQAVAGAEQEQLLVSPVFGQRRPQVVRQQVLNGGPIFSALRQHDGQTLYQRPLRQGAQSLHVVPHPAVQLISLQGIHRV